MILGLKGLILTVKLGERVALQSTLSLCVVQFYLLPSPPGQPRGQVQPFGPGGGELFEAVLSRGEGCGANRI